MEFNKNQIFVMKAAPYEWTNLAEELRTSMDYLWEKEKWRKRISYDDIDGYQEKSDISRSWLLLAGFAIENLIKGLIIAQNPSFISNGKLCRKLRNHELSKLAKYTDGITFSSEEFGLLDILEKCIPSWGRYPIPIDIDEFTIEEILNTKIKEIFVNLFDKLNDFIERILEHEWKGPHGCILRNHSVSSLESGIDIEILNEVLIKNNSK